MQLIVFTKYEQAVLQTLFLALSNGSILCSCLLMVNCYSGKFWRDNNYYANHKTQAHKAGMKASPQN